ncbi:unnamed protein product [Microthlaspi erraticum]|uniref:Uncharacterized protein n=1 Tax=Microthlaspi erraticum TaxID=1685480 RepID=A0A6D2J6D5_9BRAS|nr:unnamed protein product [Microthlaspi erraticum]
MRIEGEKGVKTQSAPKHWPRTRKKILAEQFQSGRPLRSSREGSRARPDSSIARQKVRATREPGKNGRDRPNFRIGTDRPCRSIRETTIGLGRNLSPNNLADQIARPRQNPSAIGPNFSRPR